MKNSFAVVKFYILTILLLVCFCSKSKKSSNELIFWHGIESLENSTILKEKIKEFELKNPGIKIKLQNYGAADHVSGKIMTAIAGKHTPDLMWWGPQSTGLLAKSGALVKVENYIKNDSQFNINDIYTGLIEVCKYNNEIYAIPFDANNLGLYYNKSLFENEGIDSELIKTWDDLLAAAQKLTKDMNNNGHIDQYGFQIPMGKNEWTVWAWQTFLWQAGEEFLVDNNSKAGFDSKGGVEALNFWIDLYDKYKVANFSEPNAGYKIDQFLSGKIAMMINGPWNYSLLKKAQDENGFNFGAIPLPKKRRYATNIGGENLYIFKSNTQKEKAAWIFAKYIMSPDFQVDWAITTGYLPVCKSANSHPKYKKFLQDNPFIKVYVDQMKYGKSRPCIPEYNKISNKLGKFIELALYKKISTQEALKEAASYANKILLKK